jgi:hypothetical protein
MTDEAKVFVNISVDSKTRQQLDRMVQDFNAAYGIESSRSAFIRMLIRREWERCKAETISTSDESVPAQIMTKAL